MYPSNRRNPRFLIPLVIVLALAAGRLPAQSSDASQASALSFAPSVEAAAVSRQALEAGSTLTVTALQPVGEMVEVSVAASAKGSATVLKLSADAVRGAGIAVGTAISVTAVSAGYLLSAGAEVIAFVPDEIAQSLIHHKEL